jgi:hypothetical protein
LTLLVEVIFLSRWIDLKGTLNEATQKIMEINAMRRQAMARGTEEDKPVEQGTPNTNPLFFERADNANVEPLNECFFAQLRE